MGVTTIYSFFYTFSCAYGTFTQKNSTLEPCNYKVCVLQNWWGLLSPLLFIMRKLAWRGAAVLRVKAVQINIALGDCVSLFQFWSLKPQIFLLISTQPGFSFTCLFLNSLGTSWSGHSRRIKQMPCYTITWHSLCVWRNGGRSIAKIAAHSIYISLVV